jgi:hypothetical protein
MFIIYGRLKIWNLVFFYFTFFSSCFGGTTSPISTNYFCHKNGSMESILLHSVTADEFFERLRSILKEEIKTALQQDQLLTKEGALKMAGISNATFLKAINEGIIKPQLIKGRKKAMYLESEVLRIEKKKRLSS